MKVSTAKKMGRSMVTRYSFSGEKVEVTQSNPRNPMLKFACVYICCKRLVTRGRGKGRGKGKGRVSRECRGEKRGGEGEREGERGAHTSLMIGTGSTHLAEASRTTLVAWA